MSLDEAQIKAIEDGSHEADESKWDFPTRKSRLGIICGYCRAPWAPIQTTFEAAEMDMDGNNFDRVYEVEECPNCGEFNGRIEER